MARWALHALNGAVQGGLARGAKKPGFARAEVGALNQVVARLWVHLDYTVHGEGAQPP